MTTIVFWPGEEAIDPDGKKQPVTITAWDYETKQGTAMLAGLQFVSVKMITVLTIVQESLSQVAEKLAEGGKP